MATCEKTPRRFAVDGKRTEKENEDEKKTNLNKITKLMANVYYTHNITHLFVPCCSCFFLFFLLICGFVVQSVVVIQTHVLFMWAWPLAMPVREAIAWLVGRLLVRCTALHCDSSSSSSVFDQMNAINNLSHICWKVTHTHAERHWTRRAGNKTILYQLFFFRWHFSFDFFFQFRVLRYIFSSYSYIQNKYCVSTVWWHLHS